jgi:hypothetical protein
VVEHPATDHNIKGSKQLPVFELQIQAAATQQQEKLLAGKKLF